MLIHADWALLPEGWGRDVTLREEAGRIAAVGDELASGARRVGCL